MHPSDGTEGPVATPGRRITIASADAIHHLHLCSRRLMVFYAGAALVVLWLIVASAGFVMSLISTGADVSDVDALEEAFEARIAELTAERDRYADEALSAQIRYSSALDRISEQQSALLTHITARSELESGLNLMRGKLADAVSDRDQSEAQLADLRDTLTELQTDAERSPEQAAELSRVLASVNGALDSAVRMRDDHQRDLIAMETELAALELRMQINAERQEQLVANLEDAVTASFKPLESMFETVGLDVDNLISSVRANYSGVGGPLAPATGAAAAFADPGLNDRFASLMSDMDRMNMMRIAATKVPYTVPVEVSHRFTSGFGTRRDPVTGGRRAHNGIDLAGPRGTPVVSTAEGVVSFAGRQSGYGNLIKIRHAFGYETMYAHLNKIHVKVGERIARGDHIGDMGNTGRSTGVHLHYEVRQSGKPVNPMTFIKAARDVF